jgi:hypothetical protein
MRVFHSLFDPQRWSWFAAGEEPVASTKASLGHAKNNSPDRVLWEAGWIVAIPLAVLVQLAFEAFSR